MKQKQPKALRRVLFLSFALPLLLLLMAYFIMQFWPLGDRSPLTIDLYHQYVAFISELRRKILNGESLFYSWSVGMGTNFYALLAYYAASPMNLFLLLFPQKHITEAVTFLIVTKIGLSGLSFAAMLYYGFVRGHGGRYAVRIKSREKDCGGEDFGTDAVMVALSTAYALSAFNLAYSWDIMWLDVIVLLPMVVLGIHQLIRERKFKVYTLSLALTLIVNYYMAFFVCLFSALYFFVSYLSAKGAEEERNKQTVFLLNGKKILLDRSREDEYYDKLQLWPTAFRFAGITLLAAALSAFLLFPTAISLRQTSAAGDSFPSSLMIRFSLFDFLTQHLMNIPPSIRDGLPNVYCGILSFVFVPLYLVSEKIHIKEKAAHLALLAFFFLSFNFNVLDFIWHGFHYPNQLPYRYSFLYSFVLLLIIFRTLTVIREFSTKALVASVGLGIIFVILAEKLNDELLLHGHAYINIFFFLIYLILFSIFRKPNYFRTFALLLAVVMVGELAINTIITIAKIGEKEVYTSRSAFVGDFDEVNELCDVIKEREGSRFYGDHFYRMEVLPAKTTNDGALYGYPGFTLFSSTSREDTAKFMRKFAYHGNNINSYKLVESTPVGDALFGLKYFIYKSGEPRNPYLTKVADSESMQLYENPHALAPGIVSALTFSNWTPDEKSPFVNWNQMLKEMAGIQKLFEPQSFTVVSGSNFKPATGDAESGLSFSPENKNQQTLMRLEVPVERDGLMYFAMETRRSTEVEINIRSGEDPERKALDQDKPKAEVPEVPAPAQNQKRTIRWPETFAVGRCKAGDVVELHFKQKQDEAGDVTVHAALLGEDDYLEAINILKGREIHVTDWRADGLTATAAAAQDSLLFFSIPYDDSWEVTIDGAPVQTESIGSKALLAVPMPSGEHTIDLNFRPDGFRSGLMLSLGGLVIFLLLIIDEKKFKPKRDKARIERLKQKAAARQAKKTAQAQAKQAAKLKADTAAKAKAESAAKKASSASPAAAPSAEQPSPHLRAPQLIENKVPLYRPAPPIQPQSPEIKSKNEETGE